MNILLTGGAGFIGSHVAESLIRLGHFVLVVDDLSTGKEENFDWKYPPSYPNMSCTSILNLQKLDKHFDDFRFDAVIHLAAQSSIQTSWKNAVHDATVNILGTINLLGLCQRYKVKRFVFASTSAVYAPKTTMPYMEDDTVGPLTPYGVSKAAAEHYIRISGLSYAILRLGNVYGPGQVPLGESILIARALAHIYQGEPFVINGSGLQRRDFVYVEDVADAFVKAIEFKKEGVFNIGTDSSIEVFHILEKIYNFTHFRSIPELGGWGRPVSIGFWKYGPAKEDELKNVRLSSQLAERILGWRATTPIIEGLRKTVGAWPKP